MQIHKAGALVGAANIRSDARGLAGIGRIGGAGIPMADPFLGDINAEWNIDLVARGAIA